MKFQILLLSLIVHIPFMTFSQLDSVPAYFIGSWEGTGKQHNSGEWPIEVTMHGGSQGQPVAKIAYPSLGCAGSLYLVEANENQLVLEEKIESGWRCVPTGTVTLTFAGEWIDFYWDKESMHSFRAYGMLLPVRPAQQE